LLSVYFIIITLLLLLFTDYLMPAVAMAADVDSAFGRAAACLGPRGYQWRHGPPSLSNHGRRGGLLLPALPTDSTPPISSVLLTRCSHCCHGPCSPAHAFTVHPSQRTPNAQHLEKKLESGTCDFLSKGDGWHGKSAINKTMSCPIAAPYR
jgi:hypothetical protein